MLDIILMNEKISFGLLPFFLQLEKSVNLILNGLKSSTSRFLKYYNVGRYRFRGGLPLYHRQGNRVMFQEKVLE